MNLMAETIAILARIICGCQARWSDEIPPPGPRVYYGNHTSHLDAITIWSALPRECRRACKIVAAKDYWAATKLRRWLACDVFECVLIDRKKVTRESNPLDAMLSVLDQGMALIIFPEGGRGAKGRLGEFQGGLWHLGRARPQLEFMPVWLENLNRVLPKGEVIPIPLISAATFGASFQMAGDDTKETFLKRAQDQLSQLAGPRQN